MKRVFSAFILGVVAFWLGGSHAKAGEEDAVNGVIQQQIGAFRKNDFGAAYGFAVSGIREQFTQAEFEKMVRGNFAPMVKPGAVGFGGMKILEGNAAVQLTLTAADGTKSAYQYILEKEKGEWRIAAVIPIEIEPQEQLV